MPISSGITGQRSWACTGSDMTVAVATRMALTAAANRMGTPFRVTDAFEDSNERAGAKAGSADV
jgi:hypothetical protein